MHARTGNCMNKNGDGVGGWWKFNSKGSSIACEQQQGMAQRSRGSHPSNTDASSTLLWLPMDWEIWWWWICIWTTCSIRRFMSNIISRKFAHKQIGIRLLPPFRRRRHLARSWIFVVPDYSVEPFVILLSLNYAPTQTLKTRSRLWRRSRNGISMEIHNSIKILSGVNAWRTWTGWRDGTGLVISFKDRLVVG